MSPQTAEFLLGLVNGLTLSVGATDFDEALPRVLRARQELQAIVDASPTHTEAPNADPSQTTGRADTSATSPEA